MGTVSLQRRLRVHSIYQPNRLRECTSWPLIKLPDDTDWRIQCLRVRPCEPRAVFSSSDNLLLDGFVLLLV